MMTYSDHEINRILGEYERMPRWEKGRTYIPERRRKRMAVNKDCFAYRIGGCSIMTEMICRRDTCSFYKTKEQAAADREKYGFQKNYRPKGEVR